MKIKHSNHTTVAVLTYHSIDNSGSIISTSADKFRSQMQHLARTCSNIVSLSDVVTCIRKNRPFPSKAVVITFDDGFKNFYHVAYPVLREFGFVATVFLVPGYCGKSNRWPGQPMGIPVLDLLDWDEINEMANNGIDFGAHSVSHPNLSYLPLEKTVREIVDSKIMIQEHLGREVPFFAYPYGELNERAKRVVKNAFYGACSTDLGFVDSESDIYNLHRIDMYYFSRNSFFQHFGTFFFRLYILLRSFFRAMQF